MKKLFLLFALGLIFCICSAQNDDSPMPGADCQVVGSMKRQYIQDSLTLTESESKSFWMEYNKFDIAELELHTKFRTFMENNGIKSERGKVNLSELPSEKAILYLEHKMQFKTDMQALQNSFFNTLKTILPTDKIVRYYELERDFKHVAVKKFKNQNNEEEKVLPVKKRR